MICRREVPCFLTENELNTSLTPKQPWGMIP
jgi:hypothetical protein